MHWNMHKKQSGGFLAKLPEKATKKDLPLEQEVAIDRLAEELSKRIENLVPKPQRAQVLAQVMSVVHEEFSGPIAHPKHLREYEDICAGAADRIISMAERNLAHAHTMESQDLTAHYADIRAGRIIGFMALLAVLALSGFMAYLGKDTIAAAVLGVGVLGVIGHLIQGKKKDS